MKKLDLLLISLLLLSVLAFPALAQEDPYDNRWYVGAAGGLVWPDSDRLTDDRPEMHYGLHVGRFLSPAFSLDLRLDRYEFDHDPATVARGDATQQSYGLVGRYHFTEGRTRPYFLAGLGIQEHDNFFDEGRDMYASLGLGFLHTFSDRLSLRLEAEYRRDNDRSTFDQERGFSDTLVTLGLNIPLGERPRAPAPAPEPQPVRQAAPEPAPAPPPPPRPAPEPEVIFEFSSEVTFALNSADLQPAAVAELNDAIELLAMHPELTLIQVAGHTCDLGASDYNQNLSQRRAQAVHDYLVENGIEDDRLSVRGFGESSPKVPNTSEANRRDNRRVELRVMERSDR
jgi:OOP family OmpA-OmpF porin